MPRWPEPVKTPRDERMEKLQLRDPLLLRRLIAEQREGETRSATLRRILDHAFGITRPPPPVKPDPRPLPDPGPPQLSAREHPPPGPVPETAPLTYPEEYGLSHWIDTEDDPLY